MRVPSLRPVMLDLLSPPLRPPHVTATLHPIRATRCVYVHVPRTGGTAVARALYEAESQGHGSVRGYTRELGSLAGFTTVATVRDPVDRCLSAYRALRDGGLGEAAERFADAYVRPHGTAEAFVWGALRDPSVRTSLPFRPQWTFVCDLGRRLGVNAVLRFETLGADYDAWRRAHGVGGPLPSARDAAAPEPLSPEARRRVATVYARDYAVLGYTSPAGHPERLAA